MPEPSLVSDQKQFRASVGGRQRSQQRNELQRQLQSKWHAASVISLRASSALIVAEPT